MLKTDKIADIHIHPLDGIDDTLSMLQSMVDYGIKDMNIVCINYWELPIDETVRSLYCKKVFKDANVSVFGALYYSPYYNHYGVSFLDQAKRLLDMGCDGIKLCESKPDYRKFIGFGLDSKLYDDMFDMLEERGVPIVCHINDPEEYWDREKMRKWPIGEQLISFGWLFDNDTFLTYEEIFNETIRRLEKNPKLNIIFAHFMFLSNQIELATELVEKYPNLKFDLTPGWEMFLGFRNNYDKWRDFFEKYSDRIYYGTDTHAYPIRKEIHESVKYCIGGENKEIAIPHATFESMRGFDLSKEAQENICYKNYMKEIGTPKPVNTELLIEEAENILNLTKNNNGDPKVIDRLERILSDLKG